MSTTLHTYLGPYIKFPRKPRRIETGTEKTKARMVPLQNICGPIDSYDRWVSNTKIYNLILTPYATAIDFYDEDDSVDRFYEDNLKDIQTLRDLYRCTGELHFGYIQYWG